ncbi:MAG TPA: SUMF1/EgtB/PvdO family nonheme iron enzyme [Vicinamibacteria bacterium]|nr:SUMF1/EgtB/PvdO family nonheme iron enzyme [Vicinamibacteria bacterium]
MYARVPIPAGTFLMGREGKLDNERPVHRVFVSAFEMAETPVTKRHYRVFLERTGAPPPPFWGEPGFDDPDQPVVGVSWMEARRFCRWLASESGLKIRLPTEAEREKAARGGLEGANFPWGDDPRGGPARIHGPLERPDRVRSSPPNGYGLYHMGDMVHEWCLDAYRADYYLVSPDRDPCASGTPRRSARGGSWRHATIVTPCASRSSLPPSFHYSDFGFRWIRTFS